MIRQTFLEMVGRYSNDTSMAISLWKEVEKKYSGKSRHYHNLNHLDFLLIELNEVRDSLSDWDTIIFSIAYHDLIYNPLKSNNEEKSAEVSSRRLQEIGYPNEKIKMCAEMILATRKHDFSLNQDINFFTDPDLAILGQDPVAYRGYTKAVRKEYAVFPDPIYRPGRKKVIRYFLEMKNIFKTHHFFNRYEERARMNLQSELLTLE